MALVWTRPRATTDYKGREGLIRKENSLLMLKVPNPLSNFGCGFAKIGYRNGEFGRRR